MTDDRKGYVEAWARANDGRRVVHARGDWSNPVRRGEVFDHNSGKNIRFRPCDSDREASKALNGGCNFVAQPEDLDPADGRPFVIPRLVNGAWTWDGKDEAKRCGWVNEDGQQCVETGVPHVHRYSTKPSTAKPDPYALAAGDDTRPQKVSATKPATTFAGKPVGGVAKRDPLELAATQALHFLAELRPLPGWSAQTERRLLDVARGLKEALKGGGK